MLELVARPEPLKAESGSVFICILIATRIVDLACMCLILANYCDDFGLPSAASHVKGVMEAPCFQSCFCFILRVPKQKDC